MGYNLGSSSDDIVLFSIRGVECSTMRRESSNSLLCVSGDPAIATNLGAVRDTPDLITASPLTRLSELAVQGQSKTKIGL